MTITTVGIESGKNDAVDAQAICDSGSSPTYTVCTS